MCKTEKDIKIQNLQPEKHGENATFYPFIASPGLQVCSRCFMMLHFPSDTSTTAIANSAELGHNNQITQVQRQLDLCGSPLGGPEFV